MNSVSESPVSKKLARLFLERSLQSRRDSSRLDQARAVAKSPGFDWPEVVRQVTHERIGPILYHSLRNQEILPPDLERMWLEQYHATSVRNVTLLGELERAIRLLDAGGIDVIVLKGAALIETVYHSVAVRPLHDLDVLVERRHLPAAFAILAGDGYEPEGMETHHGATLEYENERLLRKAGPIDVLLEVHWSLFDSPFYQTHLNLAWFRSSAVRGRVGDASALMLGPEAQLLHLAGHLMLHHQGVELLWVNDIAELLAAHEGELDWGQTIAHAQSSYLVLPLQRVAATMADEWSAPIPEEALARIRALEPLSEERWVFDHVSGEGRPIAQRFWADVVSLPAWGSRVRFAWANLFPSSAYMQQRYAIRHPLLVPLYYPYRWVRGLRR